MSQARTTTSTVELSGANSYSDGHALAQVNDKVMISVKSASLSGAIDFRIQKCTFSDGTWVDILDPTDTDGTVFITKTKPAADGWNTWAIAEVPNGQLIRLNFLSTGITGTLTVEIHG